MHSGAGGTTVKHHQLKPLIGSGWASEIDPSDDRSGRGFAPQEIDDVSVLRETLRRLRRSWRGLALWLCLCVGAALAYVLTATPQYVAVTQVVLEPRQPVTAPDPGAMSATQTLDSAQADSQVPIIQAERNLRYVFDTLGLASDPDFLSGGFDPIGWIRSHLPRLGSPAQLSAEEHQRRAVDQAYYKFAGGLSARRLGQSYAFEISYRALTPAKAARLANSITAAYIRDQVTYNVAAAAAQRGGDYLQNRVTDAKAEMEAAATAVKTGVIPNLTFGHADARIVSVALEPMAKSYPATTMILFLAVTFAFASGSAAVLVRDGFDRTIRSKEQVRRLIGLDVLGVLPRAVGEGAEDGASFSEAVDEPNQPFSQFVLALRTHVLTASVGAPHSVVGIVSHECGEGRTLLAANLAYAIAAAGQPATLLDADLRNPTLTRRLAPTAGSGLKELILTRGVDASGLKVSLRPMLSFVPAEEEGGDYDPHVFTGALETLQAVTGLAHTGTVVIDLPPLSVSADATAVGAALTGVLVVAALNRTTVDELAEFVLTLQARGVRVLGIVLNEGASKWQSFNVLNRLRKLRTETV